jgi:hypothetical protein
MNMQYEKIDMINAPRTWSFYLHKDSLFAGFVDVTPEECITNTIETRNKRLAYRPDFKEKYKAVYDFCRAFGIAPKQAYRIAETSNGLSVREYVAMQDYGWDSEGAWRWNDKTYTRQYISYYPTVDRYGIRDALNDLAENAMYEEFYTDCNENPVEEGRVYLERKYRNYWGI